MNIRYLTILASVFLVFSCSTTKLSTTNQPVPQAEESTHPLQLAAQFGGGVNCIVGTVDRCLRIKIINVGQGSSAIALLPDGSSILFDGGGTNSSVFQASINNAISNFLPPNATIDYLVLSHSDNDHLNLLSYVANLDVAELKGLYISGVPSDYISTVAGKMFFQKIYAAPQQNNTTQSCNLGKNAWLNLYVHCYSSRYLPDSPKQNDWPKIPNLRLNTYAVAVNADATTGQVPHSSNANSLVAGITYGSFKIMFPGDAEGGTQELILGSNSSKAIVANTSVYVFAHHGATTEDSNAIDFLQALNPNSYVSSSRRREGWYHPSAHLINSIIDDPILGNSLINGWPFHYVFNSYPPSSYCYCNLAQALLSTYTNGNITIVTDGQYFEVQWEYNSNEGMNACPTPNFC